MIAVLLVLAIGALVWFTCTSLSCTSVPAGPGEISASSDESSEEESSEPVPEPTSVRLIGFGDDLIHVSIFKQAKARATDGGYDFSYAYEPIKDVIQLADIASINQETVMAKDKAPSGYPLFNTPQELAGCLADLGFDVANLANNHVMDQAESGLKSTLDLWDSIPSVLTTGAYQNEEDFENIRTLERNGITFSFLGMTELTNGLSLPSDTELVVLRTQDEERVKAQIEKAKSISDVVVVNVHWGVEYTHKPTEYGGLGRGYYFGSSCACHSACGMDHPRGWDARSLRLLAWQFYFYAGNGRHNDRRRIGRHGDKGIREQHGFHYFSTLYPHSYAL